MPKKTFGADLYGKGENPNGMIAQTADGTVRNADALGPQDYHWNQEADGPRWNSGFQSKPESFQTPVTPGKIRKRN